MCSFVNNCEKKYIKMKIALIEIENMEFYAFHGCYHEEKIVGNKFLVDFTYSYDAEHSIANDSVYESISYLDVYEVVKMEMAKSSDLIENVADRILTNITEKYVNILDATVKVSKIAPPLGGDIERVSVKLSFKRAVNQ